MSNTGIVLALVVCAQASRMVELSIQGTRKKAWSIYTSSWNRDFIIMSFHMPVIVVEPRCFYAFFRWSRAPRNSTPLLCSALDGWADVLKLPPTEDQAMPVLFPGRGSMQLSQILTQELSTSTYDRERDSA
ncbi:uncharacterized protein H6S33_002422 [Morchella sextelata]|uniref:uncharacterized protein n=1 Tax=Morchella sextelata TaxID=1174677 RepID=UPI001D04AB9D|nr:uncharacterized protein H6S33_002422 [Morchella sextelata]KAH0607388.1 hypothetical protein H6S33_002422 [Morchella sextelata]